jgi:4-aminobutyrate aminotransferase-like enzyme/Ser/Thr protein kinase RdoA (MazF antagonist)
MSDTPQLTAAQANAILDRHWGISADRVVDLGSYEDQNLRIDAGTERYVLKVAGPSDARPPLEAEHDALAAAATLELATPSPVPARDGSEIVDVDGHRVRLLSWVGGLPLSEVAHLDEPTLRALGAVAAASSAALADADLTGPAVASKWDPRLAAEVVDDVLADDPGLTEDEHEQLLAAVAPLRELVQRDGSQLPALQTIHGDITDYNVLFSPDGPGRLRISGLIDFGDTTSTWRIADLANACVAVICRGLDEPLHALLAVVAGYNELAPPDAVELDALWPLILGRAAACAALSARQLRLTPNSEYTVAQYAGDRQAMDALLGVPTGLPEAAIRARCGHQPLPGDPLAALLGSGLELLPVLAPAGRRAGQRAAGHALAGDSTAAGIAADGAVLDLSIATDELHDGDWSDPRAIAAVVHTRHATIGRWGEIRLTASGVPGDVAPDTLHLGADLFAAPGTGVRAPVGGTVVVVAERELTLELAPGRCLRLAGIEAVARAGGAVTAGAVVGHVAERTDGGPPQVHVQLTTAPGQPGLGDPRLSDAWLALCPDPSPLIGADVAAPPPPDAAADAARRATVVAGAQELYYAQPMEIVRGSRQYLYDAHGRPYLDLINNIAVVGHSHPRVVAAAARQLRLLNTNSRFLYDSMTEYAVRLASLAPAELDRVFLVNSGSEACDLALQLARVYTGRHDIVALEGAYHGWTSAVFEACTGPDNPVWSQTKPPFVHVAAQPDPYRGAYGDDAAAYVGSVADACSAAATTSGGVAAFISEPLLGNQGGVEPPAGFLAGAYAAVRAAGGVCIADEVQVGYGRTGETFWAFEHEHVTPDIVAVAKSTGNGHPLGAVICRAEIAEAFGRRAAFFSSTGGGTVSCEVGLAVLDAIADEGLQENAARVGAVLKRSLTELAGEHELIGAVHGRGLYRGVDLVLDRDTREPAAAQARWICERIRELGVIEQPTGDRGNVLKVKPPLCIAESDAELFVIALDRALRELATIVG